MQNKLTPKYQRALDLIVEGSFSYKQIAQQVGLSPDTLYGLVEGKEAEKNAAGKLFYETLQKFDKQRDKEIKDLIKKNKKLCQKYINEYLGVVMLKKGRTKEIAMMTTIANALAKSTPNVEIGSFTYTKGLAAEDIANEWKRLQGIRRGSVDRRGVSGLTSGGTRESALAAGARDTAAQEPEDTLLRAEPETGPIPSID